MRIRFWIIPGLFLCLLAPSASAKQRKPHAGGKHPKADHPMSKASRPKKPKIIKNKR